MNRNILSECVQFSVDSRAGAAAATQAAWTRLGARHSYLNTFILCPFHGTDCDARTVLSLVISWKSLVWKRTWNKESFTLRCTRGEKNLGRTSLQTWHGGRVMSTVVDQKCAASWFPLQNTLDSSPRDGGILFHVDLWWKYILARVWKPRCRGTSWTHAHFLSVRTTRTLREAWERMGL